MAIYNSINRLLLILFLAWVIALPHLALTQETIPVPTEVTEPVPVPNPIAAQSVPQLVNNIVSAILGVVGAIALAMFVYGGLMWMTSAGNAQRIEKGKETLVWATTGLLVIFLSYGILSIVLKALSGTSGGT